MILSIQQFEKTGIKKLEKVIEKFPLEDCNQMLLDSGKRKTEWEVVRTAPKKLITSLGTVQFEDGKKCQAHNHHEKLRKNTFILY